MNRIAECHKTVRMEEEEGNITDSLKRGASVSATVLRLIKKRFSGLPSANTKLFIATNLAHLYHSHAHLEKIITDLKHF